MCVWLVDFLLRILRVDPRERPAAYEALQHPFITGHLDGRIQDWEPEGTSPQAFPISPGALRQNKHFAIRPPRPPNLNDYNVPKYDNDSLYTMNAAADVLSNAESTRVLNKVRPDGTRLPLPYPESDGPPPVPPSIQLHRTIRRPFQQHSSQTEQRAAPLSERSQGYRPAAGNNTLHYQQVRRRQDAP